MKKYLIIIIVVIISLFHWNFRYLKFVSHSMEPTIMKGDRVLVDFHRFRNIQINRWDVVAYDGPKGKLFIHRAIGLPGEKVQLKENSIIINGNKIDIPEELNNITIVPEELMFGDPPKGPFKTYEVPLDSYFLLGDNGKKSFDSRMNGTVRLEKIKGKAF